MLDVSYDIAVDMIIYKLKSKGFGILTRIDIKDKFRDKIGTIHF